MRRLLSFASLCSLLAMLLVTSPVIAAEVAWHSDLEEAFEVARETNRPLLLHFWTPDCIPCRRLERNVLNQPRVVETLETQFVPVKINAQEFPQLAARYHVSSVPKDVILNTRDEELLRLFTPQDPDQYVAQLSAVVIRSGGIPAEARSRTAASTSKQERDVTSVATRRTNKPALTAASEGGDADAVRESRFPEADADSGPREVFNRFAARNRKAVRDSVAAAESPAQATTAADGETPEETTPPPRLGEVIGDRVPAAKSEPLSSRPSRSEVSSVDRTSATAEEASGEDTSTATAQPSVDGTAVREPESTSSSQTPCADSIGLEGYCPVTLIQGNAWKKGDTRHGAIHRGKTYLFVGAAEKATFLADPDAFSPILAGVDPVELSRSGEVIEGRRAHGLVDHDRVYMFSSEENLQMFLEHPERFRKQIEQATETGDLGVFRR